MPSRRALLSLSASIGALKLMPARAQTIAQSSRGLAVVVPFPVGGGPDVLTRMLAGALERTLGQSVVVLNRPGAAGQLGAEEVARSASDGRTVLASSVNLAIQQALLPQPRVDAVQDFQHISMTGTGYSVVTVAAGSPWRSLDDLVVALRREGGSLNYGSGGIGSLAHLSGAALLSASGTRARHIPYRGSVDLLRALENQEVAFAAIVQSTALPWLRQGRLRALAVSAASPVEAFPDLPTLRQALGSEDAVIEGWSGISAPRGTPVAIRNHLHAALRTALSDPGIEQAARQSDVRLVLSPSPEDFSAFVSAEVVKFKRLARQIPNSDLLGAATGGGRALEVGPIARERKTGQTVTV